MIKRIISIFVIISVIMSYAAVSVSAAGFELNDGYTVKNWSIDKYGDFMRASKSRLSFDREEVHSGDVSLRVYGISSYGHSGFMKTYVGGLDPAKKYKAGIWVKSPKKTQGKIYLQNEGDKKYLNGTNLWTAGYEDWTYLETEEISPLASGAINLRIYFADIDGGYAWIDDISLFEVGKEDKNLFSDGGFEESCLGIRDVEVKYTGTGKNPWDNNKATISWTNPDNTHVSAVYLLDGDGNKVKEGLSISANENITCEIEDIDVTGGTEYKIVAELAHNDSRLADSRLEESISVDPLEGLDATPAPESTIETFDIPDEIYNLRKLFGTRVVTVDDKAAVIVSNPGTEYTLTEMSVVNEKGISIANVTGSGLAPNAENVIVLDNIEEGNVYNYFLKMVINGNLQYYPIGFISEGEYNTDYCVYPLNVVKNGQLVTSLSSGEIAATRIVDNRKGSDDVEVLLSAALYYDDELIQVNETAQTIRRGQYAELSATISVPELKDDKYKLVIYFWDNADDQNFIRGKSEIK